MTPVFDKVHHWFYARSMDWFEEYVNRIIDELMVCEL